MGLSPLTFTGVSAYSDDFQTILSRASTIANLPVKALQNEQSDVVQRKVLATNLQTSVQSLADALGSLADVGDHQGVSASSSDSSVVSVVSTTATTPATYVLSEITSPASAASETSATGYADSKADAVSTNGTMKLTVGGKTVEFTLDSGQNNLVGLRDKINNLGLGVTATILTTGTGSKPNYLSISANTTGKTTLSLVDDPGGTPKAWLTSTNQGSNAEFKLNGVSVSKSTNLINDVVPGITFQIAGTTSGSKSVTLSLASDRSQLKSALNTFVSTFNAVSAEVDGQIGESAGVLTGDTMVRQVQQSLRKLTNFGGSGSVKNFADLGLEMDNSGKLSLNSETFSALSDTQISAAFTFAGSGTGGIGSLKKGLTQLSDSVSGLIQVQIDQYDKTDDRLTQQISDLNTRNAVAQAALSLKLQQADTLLAQLESQQTVLDASLQSLSLTLFGKKDA
jgi:flagellar hook-associated protein 2